MQRHRGGQRTSQLKKPRPTKRPAKSATRDRAWRERDAKGGEHFYRTSVVVITKAIATMAFAVKRIPSFRVIPSGERKAPKAGVKELRLEAFQSHRVQLLRLSHG